MFCHKKFNVELNKFTALHCAANEEYQRERAKYSEDANNRIHIVKRVPNRPSAPAVVNKR